MAAKISSSAIASMRPATPEPEKPFREGDICILNQAVIVRVADVGDHVEIQGARKLPKGATVIIREDPTFDLLTGENGVRGAENARYRIQCRVPLSVYVYAYPTVEIYSSDGGLVHNNLQPVWPNDHNVSVPFYNGMIVMVKTDAFYNNKIEKVKASALFRITSETATSPGGLPVAAGSKLLPKACYQGYEVQLAEKEFTLANTRESKIRHNQLKKAPL